MLTNFSKWMIYTSSYIILYPVLIVKILFESRQEKVAYMEKIKLNFLDSKEIIFTLLGLIFVSVIVIFILNKIKPNSRCKSKLKNNVTYEAASFLIPYIISIFTIDLDWYGWLINIIIYILFGLITILADIVQLCPVFLLIGFKLYKDYNGNYVYSKLSIEQYNQLCTDQIDGIEAKMLTTHLSISTINKF